MNIDVDCADPDVALAMPFKPHNQTSNQDIITGALMNPLYKDLVMETITKYKSEPWEIIYDRVAVAICKQNIVNIQDRVLLQVSCHILHDTEAVLTHARRYDQFFKEAGIGRDKYCIKIPIVGPSMVAAKILNAEGIRTLGTSLFGLSQAIAAAQAGCLMVSPYYNECDAHANRSLWPDVEDPATQHPSSFRIISYLQAYEELYKRTGKEQPKVMSASYITAKEVVASGEIGCWAVTLPPVLLKELAETPDDSPPSGIPKPNHPYMHRPSLSKRLAHMVGLDPLAGKEWEGNQASLDVDYLADGGAALEEAMKKDAVVLPRLKQAVDLFNGREDEGKEWILETLKTLA
ncbi:hypothetical protein TREMEDRAFT_32879 [Tremella mesenterica DSM 1558]|uniref:uncharacterized protein n=1 Tax=Tremella mesenterica (strain ATCC 24925 / CBS 8224 / DSM 1558 / NBRC 9311 / NRRL Y-6157 / RJB 2259-6 / UBC 559-6) TaxID=578456 RepID=UPI0003F4A0E0|nr:uncharacterized protein TREMEDRAFT_32879 [Tremella mesenterica DSM 1558]EIW68077.1 hypothetical protein TREMEDRAFT_32879 [Tremella mesenterica DSM 1558]